jgi:hypothetical protein
METLRFRLLTPSQFIALVYWRIRSPIGHVYLRQSDTEASERSRRERKKVEMAMCAHQAHSQARPVPVVLRFGEAARDPRKGRGADRF